MCLIERSRRSLSRRAQYAPTLCRRVMLWLLAYPRRQTKN
ncbi:hypothetical protein T06_14952 [Trichinella sp. T6]|nr:hypothetical protein T06_14952 [Trichinella sp. T6]